jgi:hypothetical protein
VPAWRRKADTPLDRLNILTRRSRRQESGEDALEQRAAEVEVDEVGAAGELAQVRVMLRVELLARRAVRLPVGGVGTGLALAFRGEPLAELLSGSCSALLVSADLIEADRGRPALDAHETVLSAVPHMLGRH